MLELNFKIFPELSTERVLLRKIAMQDAEDLLAVRVAIDDVKHLDMPYFTRTMEEVKENIIKIDEGIASNEFIGWAIQLHETQKLIGSVSFHKIDKANHRAEIGYMLSPALWGTGIVSEAAKAILNYGFNELGFHSVEAHVSPDNHRSVRVLLKCNFEKEGYLKENYLFKGKFRDTLIYSLLKRNYKP